MFPYVILVALIPHPNTPTGEQGWGTSQRRVRPTLWLSSSVCCAPLPAEGPTLHTPGDADTVS